MSSYLKSLKGTLGIRGCRFVDEYIVVNNMVDSIIGKYI